MVREPLGCMGHVGLKHTVFLADHLISGRFLTKTSSTLIILWAGLAS